MKVWNTHAISGSGDQSMRGNRPIMLYTIPELYNKRHCLCEVDEREVDVCLEETTPKSAYPCDDTVRDLCLLLMQENGFLFPTNVEEAKTLYIRLREIILALL